MWCFFLSLVSEFITVPSVRAECGGPCWIPGETVSSSRVGWCAPDGSTVSEHCYSMHGVTLEHCMSGFCSFISALRADSSEESHASHTSLRISWLCNSFVLEQMISSNVGLPLLGVATGIPQLIQAGINLLLAWKAQVCFGCTMCAQLSESWISHSSLCRSCWNLWLMQKILVAFQTHPLGRRKAQMQRNTTLSDRPWTVADLYSVVQHDPALSCNRKKFALQSESC